jgi:multidrug efflux pump subunit AcrA (membrane-fusion protein)
MNKFSLLLLVALFVAGCKSKVETTKPTVTDITESVYASGVIKAENQYQVFATVNGIINNIFVTEGDEVKKGTPLLSVVNETSKLNAENARLAASYNDYGANKSKLNELKVNIDFAKNKWLVDSSLYYRQLSLWNQQVGSQVDLEQRKLAFENARALYQSALLKYDDLKRQLSFVSQQSKNNLQISEQQNQDFVVKSEVDGKVYSVLKEKGEMVTPQTALAVVGSTQSFRVELQVDEYDIVRLKKGQLVLISLDSYKGEVFEALIEKINPLMNERTKSFLVEAKFIKIPPVLYPNLTVEANVVIQTKKNVLTLPRSLVSDDGFVTTKSGDKVAVKVGLKDYERVEILSGITADDEIIGTIK